MDSRLVYHMKPGRKVMEKPNRKLISMRMRGKNSLKSAKADNTVYYVETARQTAVHSLLLATHYYTVHPESVFAAVQDSFLTVCVYVCALWSERYYTVCPEKKR